MQRSVLHEFHITLVVFWQCSHIWMQKQVGRTRTRVFNLFSSSESLNLWLVYWHEPGPNGKNSKKRKRSHKIIGDLMSVRKIQNLSHNSYSSKTNLFHCILAALPEHNKFAWGLIPNICWDFFIYTFQTVFNSLRDVSRWVGLCVCQMVLYTWRGASKDIEGWELLV